MADFLPVGVLFESLDDSGNAFNLAEFALLQEEIPQLYVFNCPPGVDSECPA